MPRKYVHNFWRERIEGEESPMFQENMFQSFSVRELKVQNHKFQENMFLSFGVGSSVEDA